jgi:two-component system phosphate regulon sensor histidine kinase PhoR
MASLSLKGLVGEVVESCARQATSKNTMVSIDVADNLHVVVNPSLVQQALVNLVDNAIKYSDGGSSVSVTAERMGEYIRCDVTDTGPGIDAAHLPRLFERFYRVDQGRSRQMGGTGLGLAIVKHIAQVHGGRVEVQSEVGKGSVFSLYLRALK